MDLEGIILSEISHMEKDKYCMISLICGIQKYKLKDKINEQTKPNKNTFRYREQSNGYQRGRGREERNG